MKYKLALIAKAITDILRQEMSPDTFDLFVVGAQNHFAYAASLADRSSSITKERK